MQSIAIPFSEFASPQAGKLYAESSTTPGLSLDNGIEQLRAHHGELDRRRVVKMRRRFDVDIETDKIAGVPVQLVTPAEGISPRNVARVLVNLHGGAFMWGRGQGSLAESIPICATGQFKVIAVHYRLAPEHRFPAASEDVAAVYAELLRQYDPQSIGIFGCSAGGILTAQVIAGLERAEMPLPGAIGTFCGTGLEIGGDSRHLDPLLSSHPPTSADDPPFKLASLPYFHGACADDPLVFPLAHDDLPGKFPPTLAIAGGRDFAASSLTLAHRRLAEAGRQSSLFLFDGLWHAFFVDPELPESNEAYALIARFFMEYLR